MRPHNQHPDADNDGSMTRPMNDAPSSTSVITNQDGHVVTDKFDPEAARNCRDY